MTQQTVDPAADAYASLQFGRTAAPTAPIRHDLNARSSIDDHPVFAALDSETRSLLLDGGCQTTLDIGDRLDLEDRVAFVQEGVLGAFALSYQVCVGIVGTGGLLGLESAVCQSRPSSVVALAECRLFEAPARLLVDGLGRAKVTELSMRHSLARLHAMQAEAACNAAHLVPQRLAKWLLRLHRSNRAREIRLTQAELARLMGVQRTAINGAARQLQDIGAVRCVRGRIIISDEARLLRAACECAV